MDLPPHDLPDDVDALKAMVLAMAREQAPNEARLKAPAIEKKSRPFGVLVSISSVIECRPIAAWWLLTAIGQMGLMGVFRAKPPFGCEYPTSASANPGRFLTSPRAENKRVFEFFRWD